ncbi:GntR family transcriptional regulator [Corynebacterium sp. HMSC08C04]|uniref:Bacterial regulatory s, gntR family protein n=1 Tax=Corynebacterium simulans TaxID=146827 RepID=A0ABR5V826_9CORY|nr:MULTISPECIES: GntR family transcriptional regulator [Corynebacterium]MDU3174568.1 GntR family transcriptional regulator [Corynebacterium striatum]KXU17555.1 bacterial regulatory s, gntR family protein [Corynebacterium simulans]OFM02281.1 GntR family transcriptional regulator [Corynebacterium sp. HMSC071F07]OFQ45527.1 GntR family transcriptional regulator [Corynebacterium sp. HMSC076D02]OFT34698.1 GntR family transcriptional regulator [Corynebacterium sp. HMSC08C04]
MGNPLPLYQQLASGIRDMIMSSQLAPGDRAPSTNELSAFHSVNPTTASKALTALFDEGLLEKRRGLGMFVTPEARTRIAEKRRAALHEDFVAPLLAEARALGITTAELIELIKSEGE